MTKYTWKVGEAISNKTIATKLKMSQARQVVKNLSRLHPELIFIAYNPADYNVNYDPDKDE